MPRAVFDFFDGGAEDELTLADNRAALQSTRLIPRPLRDVSNIDTKQMLFGQPLSLPMAIAPMGALGYGRPGADIALAKAATRAGLAYSLSSSATTSIENIEDQAPGRLWFQAYILRDKPFLASLVERAKEAEYEALIITVDLPVGGKRERDTRNDFGIPFKFTPRNVWDFALHPRWVLDIAKHGMPVMENLVGLVEDEKANASNVASSVGKNYDASFDWEALARMREAWPRKFIVKGLLHPEDASKAQALGVDAIVVSNHGGRQLDSAIACFDALPAIVAAVSGKCPILMDGGIRRGSDVLKALAAGASGVLLGRAALYGAISGGEQGTTKALNIIADELIRSMRLCGATSLAGLTPDLLFAK